MNFLIDKLRDGEKNNEFMNKEKLKEFIENQEKLLKEVFELEHSII
jgi:hypothetical protein